MARGFLAFEAHEEIQQDLPAGREIAPSMRHMTLVFFPEVCLEKIIFSLNALNKFPKVGFGGIGNKLIWLPERHPGVLAWEVDFGPNATIITSWQNIFSSWAIEQGFRSKPDTHSFLPHVSLCRSPFKYLERAQTFQPCPISFPAIHLYESAGHLNYIKRWTKEFISPYEETQYATAIAYKIAGNSLDELYWNACLALGSRCPLLLPNDIPPIEMHKDIICHINRRISLISATEKLSVKAVSYHGELQQRDSILYWQMIIDV